MRQMASIPAIYGVVDGSMEPEHRDELAEMVAAKVVVAVFVEAQVLDAVRFQDSQIDNQSL
jgi:hypothetical protein